ncbi:MAG: hypothetical protein ACPHXR_00185 [Flavicella sp.]
MTTKIKILFMVILLSLFQSCSELESDNLNKNESPLKSYTLSRDVNGSYTLEQHLNDGIISKIVPNQILNEIIFEEGKDDVITQTSITPSQNNDVRIEFLTENHIQIPGITVYESDKATTYNKTTKDINYVKSYEMKMMQNGSYELKYTLKQGYYPTYEYNKEKERHQIRLNQGEIKENQTSFSKNYIKFEGEKLNIIFVRKSFINSTTEMNRRQLDFPEPPEFEIAA